MVQRNTPAIKILFVSYDGMTDPLGQSQVIPYLQGLSQAGYDVTILSFEKKWRLAKYQQPIQALLQPAGIEWHPLIFSHKIPILSKLYDVLKMKAYAIKLCKKNKFSMVHCRSYVPAEAGKLLHKKFGIPFLFDMRGFWVDERVDNGQWKLSNPFYKHLYNLYKKKEKKYLQSAAHIISLTHTAKVELTQHYQVPAHKIEVIPCCVDVAHFNYNNISTQSLEAKKAQLNIAPSDIVISYLGTIGGWYLVEEMLDFFKLFLDKNPCAKFLWITPAAKEVILEKAKQKAIPQTAIIVQFAERNEVPLYLACSNWSIFFIKDAYSKKASSPTKQGEIMAMGLPLICNNIGDTGSIVLESNAGFVINNFCEATYKTIINKMNGDVIFSKENIRTAAIKNYLLEDGIKAYAAVYKKIIERQVDNK